jgi:predicted AAA+ superfamily ATPase
MQPVKRALKEKLTHVLERGKSVLLLGPRQTGKTTLLREYQADLEITLLIAKIRRQYEADPDQLIRETKALRNSKGSLPLVIIDEVQKVPALMDGVQYLIDGGIAQFVLTGSSARKLKNNKDVNLLPGRLIQLRLDPLTLEELSFPLPSIEDFLFYGSLPAIRLETDNAIREEELDSYVGLYLEDEVRAEALVRDIGAFENFLRLAAIESGNIVNFDRISQDIGVARTTIASYYQILEDCLVAERVEPYMESRSRKKLTRSPKYLLFDLGLRRLAAEEQPSFPVTSLGSLFEQFIGLELIRWARLQNLKTSVHFWRDPSGPEVDWLLRRNQSLLPIEVKWTDNPSLRDAKHLELFLKEYPTATKGYVVCQVDRPQILSDGIEAISWQDLMQRLSGDAML